MQLVLLSSNCEYEHPIPCRSSIQWRTALIFLLQWIAIEVQRLDNSNQPVCGVQMGEHLALNLRSAYIFILSSYLQVVGWDDSHLKCGSAIVSIIGSNFLEVFIFMFYDETYWEFAFWLCVSVQSFTLLVRHLKRVLAMKLHKKVWRLIMCLDNG